MGFLVVNLAGPNGADPHIMALPDSDTLHEYFAEYLTEGWTQEILTYSSGDIDDWDYADKLEHDERLAHRWRGSE